MRITNSMVVQTTLRDLSAGLGRLQESQGRLTSGRRLEKPSDDPAALGEAMTLRAELRRADQRARSLSDAQGWLDTADQALQMVNDGLNLVSDLVVQAGNVGTSTPESRAALANEIEGVRAELLGVANTRYVDRPIFNGTAAPVGAYDLTTGAYLGDSGVVHRETAPGTVAPVNLTGPQVFGDPSAPAGDLFAVLDRLADAVRAGDSAATQTEWSNLDAGLARVHAGQVEIGARARTLEANQAKAVDDQLRLKTQLSAVEDVDFAATLIDVKAQEAAYQGALAAAAKILPPSLLDFLR
jgi:flagellar hook-associated protein 3 FlgL